jgi:hypothetical protein
MWLPVPECDFLAYLGRWTALILMLIFACSCATAELVPGSVDETDGHQFHAIHLKVALSNQVDTASLINSLMEELDKYDLQASFIGDLVEQNDQKRQQTALLTIEEVERRYETMYYRRTYGRTSLTQMRGRKSREVPVITLRVVLTDTETDIEVFQADYVTRGPWYADSAKRVASLARALTRQLEQGGLITSVSR